MNALDGMTELELRELVSMAEQLQRLSTKQLAGITLTKGQHDTLNWLLEQMEGKHHIADLALVELARLDWNRAHPGHEFAEQRADFKAAVDMIGRAAA